MLFIKMLIKILLITKLCQSLTRKTRSTIKEHPKFKPHNSTTIFKVMPNQQGSSESSTLRAKSLINSQQPGYFNNYPNQYRYSSQCTATRPKTKTNSNEQPAIGASLESEILHEAKRVEGKVKHQQPSSVKYNNKIYHINTVKRASPWKNNEQAAYPKFIVRKQRNLKENHDDKLIEQNIRGLKNVNEGSDQQYTRSVVAASSLLSVKQPFTMSTSPTTTRSSHEIQYLHDIFLNYPKLHHVNFGHIELSPTLFQKRFQSQKLGNRYKGEIMWLDNTGGFAQHNWDLAQGRL